MFSFITMNWRGRPLVSYRTVVQLIAGTTTKKGLKIQADRDEGYYPLGVRSPTKNLRRFRSPTRVPRRVELHGPLIAGLILAHPLSRL